MIRFTAQNFIRSMRIPIHRQFSSSFTAKAPQQPWGIKFGKWALGTAVAGGGGFVMWLYDKKKEEEEEAKKYGIQRKVQVVEDCFVKYEKRANLSPPGIPGFERSDFFSTVVNRCKENIVNVEGPQGSGKSSFFAALLASEHEKGTPVAHLEMRGIDLSMMHEKCSVSNYVCYRLGLETAVDSGKVVMDISESSKYVEQALRKLQKEGQPPPILVIDDIQNLFEGKSVNIDSSLNFLKLLVHWHVGGLARPILVCSQGSISDHFNRVSGMSSRTRTSRLPEVDDEMLRIHLQEKANSKRIAENKEPWSDEDIRKIVDTYGADFKGINSLFNEPSSPEKFISADVETKANLINKTLTKCKGCKAIIKDVLINGYKSVAEGDDEDSLKVLIDANILAVIERKYRFHSRLVKRAAEGTYGSM